MRMCFPGFKMLVKLSAALSLIAGMQCASAAPVVYNFDTFADSVSITNQIAGMTFVNTVVLKAGQSLNEFEFPPRSGNGVAFDLGGPITINFAAPVFSVGGYFTYSSGLNFSAFDVSNNLLGTDTADFGTNFVSSGNSPNELLSFSAASGLISRIVITGDPSGGSFTMDDLTVDATGNSVPEPQTLVLVLSLLASGFLPGSWLRSRRIKDK